MEEEEGEQQIEGQWKDITNEIREACSELGIGEIVHRPDFTLYESLSALELMSPKMDSGLKPGYDIDKAIQTNALILPVPTLAHLVSLCDHIFLMEIAYQEGNSLPTTVHSCIYLHKHVMTILEEIKMKNKNSLASVSFAIFSAILYTSGLVRLIVRLADIYEEEDFMPMLHDLDSGQNYTNETIVQLLEEALIELDSIENSSDSESVEMIRNLISFRIRYMRALHYMKDNEGRFLVEAETLWAEIREEYDFVGPNRSKISGKPAVDAEINEWAMSCFDASVNQKLFSGFPPRSPAKVDIETGHAHFKSFVDDMLLVCQLRHATRYSTLYASLCDISAKEPNIVIRSCIVPLLYTESKLALGKYTYESLIETNMLEDFGVPAFSLASETCKRFIELAIKPMYEVLRLTTANRARQRRNIANLLPDWAQLQMDAEIYDQILFNENNTDISLSMEPVSQEVLRDRLHYSLGYWCSEWSIRLMLRHASLGFELQVYSVWEYDAVLWHMQYFLSRQSEFRNDMTSFLQRSLERLSKSKRKDVVLQKQVLEKQVEVLQKNLTRRQETLFIESERMLVDGIIRLVIALRKEKRFESPVFEFGSERIRFNHRFAAYACVSFPKPLTYDDYVTITDLSKYDAASLYDTANIFLSRCKTLLSTNLKAGYLTTSQTARLKLILKAVIGYSVAITRAKADKSIKLEFYLDPAIPYPSVK